MGAFSKSAMCPPYFSLSPNVPHVTMWNDKILPYPFNNGGMVNENHQNIPDGVLKKNDKDTVFARLMPGELIIPVKHVKLVSKFLKNRNINLPGM